MPTYEIEQYIPCDDEPAVFLAPVPSGRVRLRKVAVQADSFEVEVLESEHQTVRVYREDGDQMEEVGVFFDVVSIVEEGVVGEVLGD